MVRGVAIVLLVAVLMARVARGDDAAANASASGRELRISIEDAMAMAGPASEDVAAARAGVDRAQAQVGVARSELFPRVDANGAYQRTIRSEFENLNFGPTASTALDLPFGRANTWRAGVTASQWVWTGGRIAAQIEARRAGADSSRIELDTARAQAVLDTARAYYDAVLATRQVEIARLSLEQAEETLRQTRLELQVGQAPEYDVLRAEVSRDNQQLSLAQFRARQRVAFARLRRLIGAPAGQRMVLTSGLDPSDDLGALAQRARAAAGLRDDQQRAPVAQAAESVRAGRAVVRSARAAWWPQIRVWSDLGWVSYPNDLFPAADDWRENWSVGIDLSFPVFDGWRIASTVAAARADLGAAQARLQQTEELSLLDEIETDTEVEIARDTWQSSARTAELAERAYEIAVLRYDEGASNQLELIEARFQLRQARLNQAQASRDERVARLRRALLPALPIGAAAAIGQGAGEEVGVGVGVGVGTGGVEEGVGELPGRATPAVVPGRPGTTTVLGTGVPRF